MTLLVMLLGSTLSTSDRGVRTFAFYAFWVMVTFVLAGFVYDDFLDVLLVKSSLFFVTIVALFLMIGMVIRAAEFVVGDEDDAAADPPSSYSLPVVAGPSLLLFESTTTT